ncbi:MAG: hypothetical protein RLZZ70_418 [Candidatus Parcubacteria bacterium]|jgi:hypothetical protein
MNESPKFALGSKDLNLEGFDTIGQQPSLKAVEAPVVPTEVVESDHASEGVPTNIEEAVVLVEGKLSWWKQKNTNSNNPEARQKQKSLSKLEYNLKLWHTIDNQRKQLKSGSSPTRLDNLLAEHFKAIQKNVKAIDEDLLKHFSSDPNTAQNESVASVPTEVSAPNLSLAGASPEKNGNYDPGLAGSEWADLADVSAVSQLRSEMSKVLSEILDKATTQQDKENAQAMAVMFERLLSQSVSPESRKKAAQQIENLRDVLKHSAIISNKELVVPEDLSGEPVLLDEPIDPLVQTDQVPGSAPSESSQLQGRPVTLPRPRPGFAPMRAERLMPGVERRESTTAESARREALFERLRRGLSHGVKIALAAAVLTLSSAGPKSTSVESGMLSVSTVGAAENPTVDTSDASGVAPVLDGEEAWFMERAPLEVGVGGTANIGEPERVDTDNSRLVAEAVAVLDAVDPEVVDSVQPDSEVVEPMVSNEVIVGEEVSATETSSDRQEALDTLEAVPKSYVAVAVFGDVSTYPDNQLNRFFAQIDTTGLDAKVVADIQAEMKLDFYTDHKALVAAGFASGDVNVFYPGDVLVYDQPVLAYEAEIAKLKSVTNESVPGLTVEKGDTITELLVSENDDVLKDVAPADQAKVVYDALQNYITKTPDGLAILGITNINEIVPGQKINLEPVRPFITELLNETVATNTTNETVVDTAGLADVEPLANDEAVIDTATPESPSAVNNAPEALTPATYPGGELAYSRDYNIMLDSLGIAVKDPSIFDNAFTQAGPTSRALLQYTTGNLTNVMLNEIPAIRNQVFLKEGIDPMVAEKVYREIVALRMRGEVSSSLDSKTETVADVLKKVVLAAKK